MLKNSCSQRSSTLRLAALRSVSLSISIGVSRNYLKRWQTSRVRAGLSYSIALSGLCLALCKSPLLCKRAPMRERDLIDLRALYWLPTKRDELPRRRLFASGLTPPHLYATAGDIWAESTGRGHRLGASAAWQKRKSFPLDFVHLFVYSYSFLSKSQILFSVDRRSR